MPSPKPASRSFDRAFLLAGLGTAAVGLLVLAGLAFFHARDVERRRAFVPATGVVVGQRDEGYGARSRVVLTVRFTTAAGRSVELERRYDSTTTVRPTRGETVTVLYDPTDPARAEIQDGGWIGTALVGAVGVGFLILGLTLGARPLAAWRNPPTGRRRDGSPASRSSS